MEGVDNFDVGFDFVGGFEFVKVFVVGGDDFGEIFGEVDSFDFLEKGVYGCGVNCGMEMFDEGGIFFYG